MGDLRVLAVRLDSDGDVLLTGPALRALAAAGATVDLLVSPAGEAAGRLLPAVRDVLVFDPPWSGYQPAPFDADAWRQLVERLRARRYEECVVFTSFHQSPLPMALAARLAGIPRVCGTSEDYPGSLLDVRARRMPGGSVDDGGPGGGHEVEAALRLAAAAGHHLPPGDDGALRVRLDEPRGVRARVARPRFGAERYVVVHPAGSVPARSLTGAHAHAIVTALETAGWRVVLTGTYADRQLTAAAATSHTVDLTGRTSFAELAHVLAGAACTVVGNTGPAHLSAAVGTPVVSLFSPVVPAERWAPWQVPHVLLGDQAAPCRGTRARECPVTGHPCLSTVPPSAVAEAVASLTAGDEPQDTVWAGGGS
ncbi:MAG TPA: glycosyltransferase family 9 protein [Segeticoccus sp.]|uniref:glycosyltransferase family 9 protein n=1 Tax=Segeticoccus sp. TaxID=2706531 RepID=UPI002D7FB7EC|nr:glycosyltransferase family 9 protein [Segeticoccus sp.]HET8600764.1 glycosyltransferase family 9 protein [Segeticoccus sp.]